MKINEWLCINVFEMESVKLELYLVGIKQENIVELIIELNTQRAQKLYIVWDKYR